MPLRLLNAQSYNGMTDLIYIRRYMALFYALAKFWEVCLYIKIMAYRIYGGNGRRDRRRRCVSNY